MHALYRLFPSYLVPLFQNEVSCKTFLQYENGFDLCENEFKDETHFHVNGVARRLILLQRQKATQKWSISSHIFCSTVQCFSIPCQAIVKVPYLTLVRGPLSVGDSLSHLDNLLTVYNDN